MTAGEQQLAPPEVSVARRADQDRRPAVGSVRGFTLVEVTVMLAVVGMLVGLMAGSVGDLLGTSREVRTRDDVEKIGRAIVDFYRDNGFFPHTEDTVGGRPGSRELGVLASDAPMPEATGSAALWLDTSGDLMGSHLTRNVPGYRNRNQLERVGWAGPYLGQEPGEDGWGYAYLVNVFYLDPRDVLQEVDGTPLGAVYVLSAGPNGIIETPFYQPRDNATTYGDDIGYRLQ